MLVDRIVKFFASLRLTVVLLGVGVALVFLGTLAQTDEGLYAAQARWFRSFLVVNAHIGPVPIPIFPGGYLLGTMLLVNLLTAHITRFKLTWKKSGLFLIHIGIILLLVGQLATDMLATESNMELAEGESKNYSENGTLTELVFITDAADPSKDDVVSISERTLAKRSEIMDPRLPCMVRVVRYMQNSQLARRAPMADTEPPASNQGFGTQIKAAPAPLVTKMNERNMPSAVIELVTSQGTIGSWLVSSWLNDLQEVQLGSKTYRIGLRWTRYYKPFSLELLKFSHDKYRGTEKPKNYSSRVRLNRPDTSEPREVLIYMNSPLRYDGETYYQASFAPDNDQRVNKVTILQVVRNPSWLTPYLACFVVFAGLSTQFLIHLFGFVSKRRTA